MSRLNVPSPDDVPDGAKGVLGTIGAQFGFVPSMFATLASNPTVLDVVMTLQGTLSRVLDAKTRRGVAGQRLRLLPGDPHIRVVRTRWHVVR